MKKTILSISFLFITLILSAQVASIDRLFEKYSGEKGYTYVYISPDMFELLGHLEFDDDEEVEELIKNLTCIKILVSEDDWATDVNFYEEVIDELDTDEYKELMVVREDDMEMKFLAKEVNGIISDFLLIGGGEENILISIQGNIDLNKLSSLSHSFGISGIRHLERLDDDIF